MLEKKIRKELFKKMDAERKDCLIPSEMVPKYPVYGGNMAMHLRCDSYFVEDETRYEAAVPESFGERAIGIGGDMVEAVRDIFCIISVK